MSFRIVVAITILAGHSWIAHGAEDSAISRAIEQGATYLRRNQNPDGSWGDATHGPGHLLGETTLVGLALLAAGDASDSKPILAATEALAALAPDNEATYDVSLAILFIDRLEQRTHDALLHRLIERLAGGQCSDGSWTYSSSTRFGQRGGGDNSNTQFAAIASWVDRRHLPTSGDSTTRNEASLRRLDAHFRRSVNAGSGGWGYTPGATSTPSMTCAGLVALATHRGAQRQAIVSRQDSPRRSRWPDGAAEGERPSAVDDPVVERALAYLGATLRSDGLVNDLYFYWSLERVGVIYGLQRIGGVDWFALGAPRLARMQAQDGNWGSGPAHPIPRRPATVDTSFAILFLSRSNVAEDLTAEIAVSSGTVTIPRSAPTSLNMQRLERPRPTNQESAPEKPKPHQRNAGGE